MHCVEFKSGDCTTIIQRVTLYTRYGAASSSTTSSTAMTSSSHAYLSLWPMPQACGRLSTNAHLLAGMSHAAHPPAALRLLAARTLDRVGCARMLPPHSAPVDRVEADGAPSVRRPIGSGGPNSAPQTALVTATPRPSTYDARRATCRVTRAGRALQRTSKQQVNSWPWRR